MTLIDFIDQLTLRFKMSIIKIMNKLHTKKYFLEDAFKKRDSQKYL